HLSIGGNLHKTVTIAAPVRNREWILPEYLKAIEKIEYPKHLIELKFVLNDSTDNTATILENFRLKMRGKYRKISIEIYNRDVPEDRRELNVRNNYIYDHLSKLKNFIITRTKTDYLLFIDTDILVPPDIINNLLNHQVDIVSALIWNGYLTNPDKPYLYPNVMKMDNGSYHHIVNHAIKNAPTGNQSSLLSVDLTGAVVLISRAAYRAIRYGFHPQGEDAHLCKMAQEKGFELFCDVGLFCHHIMNEKLLGEFLNEKENNCLC
ncbi:hypothetical protein ACFVSK_21190, partial [Cellulosimicrobium cellulans]|uniref:hypothetical protein n=1 Tax=Cellulosimicrobium cellulans TaxID=1710 RepID=UPI0036DFCB6A